MPVYEYTAINARGKTVSGIINADGEASAREKLRARNIYPASIKRVYYKSEKKRTGKALSLRLFSGVRPAELAAATRQLSTLVGSGLPLTSAISALISQAESTAMKKTLSRIKDSIEEGQGFAEALSSFPELFSPIYINMVRAGESSGTLEIVLERLALLQENHQAQKNKIKAILAYPAVMTILGSGVLVFLLVKIVPKLTSILTDMNRTLPLPTRLVVATSTFLQSHWLLILTALLIACLGVWRLGRTEQFRQTFDRAVLHIPGVKSFVLKIAAARFSRTLGSLLEHGIPMLTALGIVKNIVGNTVIADAIGQAATGVEKGEGLGVSLEKTSVFPPLSIQMIKVGEQSGDLEKMLQKTADVFENEVDTALVGLTSLLEPLLVVIMGIVVGFIVLSIVLPIFEMYQFGG